MALSYNPPPKFLTPPVGNTRRKSSIQILAGPDITDILGLDAGLTTTLTTAGAGTSNLYGITQALGVKGLGLTSIGTIEHLEVTQTRTIRLRYGFNSNPYEAYQSIPAQMKVSLRGDRVVLKKVQAAEELFSFLSPSLMFQKLPFIIQIEEIGDPGDPSTFVTRIFYGCWFDADAIKYGVSESHKEDQRLISNVSITAARMLVLNTSAAGTPGGQLSSSVAGAILATTGSQALLDFVPL